MGVTKIRFDFLSKIFYGIRGLSVLLYIQVNEMSRISPRERQVLHLIAFEHTTQEIALQLSISSNTALTHRKNLLAKLGVRNVAGLIRKSFELGLLSIESVAA